MNLPNKYQSFELAPAMFVYKPSIWVNHSNIDVWGAQTMILDSSTLHNFPGTVNLKFWFNGLICSWIFCSLIPGIIVVIPCFIIKGLRFLDTYLAIEIGFRKFLAQSCKIADETVVPSWWTPVWWLSKRKYRAPMLPLWARLGEQAWMALKPLQLPMLEPNVFW